MYLFLTPSKTDEEVPIQQGAPSTCNLTHWEVSPADVGHRAKLSASGRRGRGLIGNWVWLKSYIHPFSGGGGGEEGLRGI